MNPIEKANFIEKEYREYLKYTFSFKDEDYKEQFIRELDAQTLYKGPYLNVSLPFKTTKSIDELMDEGKISRLFEKMGKVKFEQKLYYHQEVAFDKISSGRNVVITTGTGSGKTESFLYPIINSILQDIERNDNPLGIRAIFLYPMNALVNDQIDRVREMLGSFPEIRFGFFTGDTPETETKNLREELAKDNESYIPINEVLSREDMRNNPPHLLFTNYSMLEYLLIRPNDFKIFKKEYLKKWRFIVMDEAHTYNGTLGIEISYLLKRLTGLSEKKPQFILTSATLGEKNRDEKDIVNFAETLTSAPFAYDDIIFSVRRELNHNEIRYQVSPEFYINIENNLEDVEKIKQLLGKYIDVSNTDVKELLYDFLKKDSNVYYLYDLLKKESLQFKEVMALLISNGFSNNDELVALIHLINIARKNFQGIYDIKYHTFIRTLAGAYVTVCNPKKLKLSLTYDIDALKAFELGTCRYCNASFIFGKEMDGFLRQNDDIDIYENYGDNEAIIMDYYYLPYDEEFDKENCEEYILCGKCGRIYNKSNKNAIKCDCADEYKISVYKVESSKRNNINRCPSCLHQSKNGIVRSVNLGKDEATAILAQILYKAIDSKEKEKKEQTMYSFSNYLEKKADDKEKYVKQFIAFSDSRQQASFFATFFEANHLRFLRKRLIWEVIKNNNYNSITFDSLISQLDRLIQSYNLFPGEYSTNKQAWIAALYELLLIDGNYSAEGLGLFHFSLNLDNILDKFDEEDIRISFGKYNIDKKDLKNIINVIFNVFRVAPAIDYSISELSLQEKQEYFNYRRFDNYVLLKKPNVKNNENDKLYGNVRSLIPIGDTRENNIISYIKRVANCSRDEAVEIIKQIYEVIGLNANLFNSDMRDNRGYQISSSKYILDNYKNTQYYKCLKCGKLTIYNVHDICPSKDCDGILVMCDPDLSLNNNYYRKEYMTKRIERINIKEHTAQLSKAKAKEYQKEFKNKKINILSCSTTFEMGIDIGSLENVFMRNVPPTPANYVQRAGRAGRSDNSSAFVLTFCNYTSHDYTYFENPNKMISGVIKPPKFNADNEKIILRHLLSTAFSFFFRKYPDYFKNVKKLVLNGGITTFKKYLEEKPEDLNDFINEKVLNSQVKKIYGNFKWLNELKVNGNYLDRFVVAIEQLVKQYENAIDKALEDTDYKNANFYKEQIKKIENGNVIEYLTKYNVLPKYGFPIDLVNLEVWNNGKIDNTYDLSRDLSMAISEYAPDSEIIVDKIKYTSKYISLPKAKEFTKYYYYTCLACERDNVDEFSQNLAECQYCGALNNEGVNKYFIEPIYGFKTGITKESTTLKPQKTYAGAISYIGNGIQDDLIIKMGNNDYLTIRTSSDDELLVINKNPFFMCEECGFAMIDKNNVGKENIWHKHLTYYGQDCGNDKLVSMSLGHKFRTDVAQISIRGLCDKNKALSALYAILEGISQEFTIERKDIDGLVIRNKLGSYDMIIFDNVPGGAGHVKRIMNKEFFISTLKLALEKVSQECCDENSSCYNCLRNYSNQYYHKKLKRKYAKEAIEEILKNVNDDLIVLD